MDRQTIFLLVGILILILILIIKYSHFLISVEGFVNAPSKKIASLPKPEGNSTVPNSMPGSVSEDPIDGLASYKDIASLIDTIKAYNDLYDKFIINIYKNSEFQVLHTKSAPYLIKLQAQIDTGKIVDKLDFITSEREKYNKAIRYIHSDETTYKKINKKTATILTKPMIKGKGVASLKDLEFAIERAQKEKKRIDDLRSESADFKQRALILEKIQLDFKEIHNKVTKNDMKPDDIPVQKKDLLKFLIDVENPTSKLTPLPKLKRAQSDKKTCEGFKNSKNTDEDYDDNDYDNLFTYDNDDELIDINNKLNGFQKKTDIDNSAKRSKGNSKKVNQMPYLKCYKINKTDSDDDDDDIDDDNSVKAYNTKDITHVVKSAKSQKKEGFSNFINEDKEDQNEEFKSEKVEINQKLPRKYQNMINNLRSSLRDLSWDLQIDIGYDPNVTIQRRITERLNTISNEIESGLLKKTDLKSKFLELRILKQQLESYNSRRITASKAIPESAYDSKQKYREPNVSDSSLIMNNKDLNKKEEPEKSAKPLASNDYNKRPGFEMTREQIKARGSGASFESKSAGTLDYKKTVQFLCSQIKSAGLGEPREFGCITNPEQEVGPEYSWKGNYKMVCSRLGHTWGDFYPEMFGCPAPDMSHMQHPKINKTCTTSAYIPPPIAHPNIPCKA